MEEQETEIWSTRRTGDGGNCGPESIGRRIDRCGRGLNSRGGNNDDLRRPLLVSSTDDDDVDDVASVRDGSLAKSRLAECDESTIGRKAQPPWQAVLIAAGQVIFIVVLVVAPNVGFVLLTISKDVPFTAKQWATYGMTVVKVLTVTVTVPRLARLLVDKVPTSRVDRVAFRFRLRLVASAVLSSFSWVAAPLVVVVLSDPRCMYYAYAQTVLRR